MPKEMILCAFDMNCVGHQSQGLWRHPRDRSEDYKSMTYWQDLAKTLERGMFDGIFLADVSGLYDVYGGSPDTALRAATQVPANDPFTIVPVMAAVTENLAFGVTGSIPYEPPFSFARRMSSLDHLTEGRIGWNIVTGYLDSAAKASGKKKKDSHDVRYDIAFEYMEVVYRLWEQSWEDGAVLRDRESGVFVDPAKVHEINYEGEYFQVTGRHICEPSPQRTPVLFQAGASPKGKAFAGGHAECVFIGAETPETNAKHVKQLREQALEHGRDENDLKILAVITVVTAATDEAAQAKFEDYQQYGDFEGALALLSGWTGIDFSKFDLDKTAENLESDAIQSALQGAGCLTIRQWANNLTVGGAGPVIVGSPKTIADELERWLTVSGIDGFNIARTVSPESIEDFVDLIVPELQDRGLFKRSYQSGTFREKLFGKTPLLSETHPGSEYRK
jgi:FMN-dependent oxidoreductase (nitrilotriacetate monooxygenase family)